MATEEISQQQIEAAEAARNEQDTAQSMALMDRWQVDSHPRTEGSS